MYPTAQMSAAETATTAVSWSPPRVAALLASGLLTMDQVLPFQCSVRVVAGWPAGPEEPTAQTSLEETAATPASWVLAAAAPAGTRAALRSQVGAQGVADPPPEGDLDAIADGEGVRALLAELHPATRVRIASPVREIPRRLMVLTPVSPTLTTTETGGDNPRLRRGGGRQECAQVLDPGAGAPVPRASIPS